MNDKIKSVTEYFKCIDKLKEEILIEIQKRKKSSSPQKIFDRALSRYYSESNVGIPVELLNLREFKYFFVFGLIEGESPKFAFECDGRPAHFECPQTYEELLRYVAKRYYKLSKYYDGMNPEELIVEAAIRILNGKRKTFPRYKQIYKQHFIESIAYKNGSVISSIYSQEIEKINNRILKLKNHESKLNNRSENKDAIENEIFDVIYNESQATSQRVNLGNNLDNEWLDPEPYYVNDIKRPDVIAIEIAESNDFLANTLSRTYGFDPSYALDLAEHIEQIRSEIAEKFPIIFPRLLNIFDLCFVNDFEEEYMASTLKCTLELVQQDKTRINKLIKERNDRFLNDSQQHKPHIDDFRKQL